MHVSRQVVRNVLTSRSLYRCRCTLAQLLSPIFSLHFRYAGLRDFDSKTCVGIGFLMETKLQTSPWKSHNLAAEGICQVPSLVTLPKYRERLDRKAPISRFGLRTKLRCNILFNITFSYIFVIFGGDKCLVLVLSFNL